MCSGKYTSEPLIPNFKCGGPFSKALVHSFLKFSFLFYDTLQQKHPNFLLLLPTPHWLWQSVSIQNRHPVACFCLSSLCQPQRDSRASFEKEGLSRDDFHNVVSAYFSMRVALPSGSSGKEKAHIPLCLDDKEEKKSGQRETGLPCLLCFAEKPQNPLGEKSEGP